MSEEAKEKGNSKSAHRKKKGKKCSVINHKPYSTQNRVKADALEETELAQSVPGSHEPIFSDVRQAHARKQLLKKLKCSSAITINSAKTRQRNPSSLTSLSTSLEL
ncbi:hypothetical protein KOW79_011874 [Hemibagrus wyckioides]|uniref:Uncharacterized protein n=1 Tax=Hemibagrus wyckioides TaxID=337641 RepID=A0A9D3NQN4_9TELE|nr:hypothetical protein KOW79_011874 [Hemibagrus wyckioides]